MWRCFIKGFLKKTRPWWILIGLGLSRMLIAIDFTIVNMVLPNIQQELSVHVSQLQWIMGAFGISFATLLTIMGRVGDILGRRILTYCGMAFFLVTSFGAGLARGPNELIFFRFLQGVCCAMIIPGGMALVIEAFPSQNRGRAIGIYAALFGIGLALGPVLGGFIVSIASWRWVFFINAPLVLLSFLICLPFVKESKKMENIKIDWKGALLFILGFGALIFGITEGPNEGWGSFLIVGSFILSFALLCLFYFVEKRAPMPICPFHLFTNRGFYLGCIILVASVGTVWALLFLLPLYLLDVLNLSSAHAGWLLFVMTATTVISSVVMGILGDRKGHVFTAFLMFATILVGLLLMLLFHTSGPLWLILITFAIFGWGWGSGNSIATPLALSKMGSTEHAGIVMGALVTVLNTVAVFLLSISGTLFRFGEKWNLNAFLKKENLHLTPEEMHQVRSSLLDPDHAKSILSHLGGENAEKIIAHFKTSFMGGFHLALIILLALISVLLLVAFKPLLLEKKSGV